MVRLSTWIGLERSENTGFSHLKTLLIHTIFTPLLTVIGAFANQRLWGAVVALAEYDTSARFFPGRLAAL